MRRYVLAAYWRYGRRDPIRNSPNGCARPDLTWSKIPCAPRARKAARSMKTYLRIRDSSDDQAGQSGFGTFLGIDLRERNFARIRAA